MTLTIAPLLFPALSLSLTLSHSLIGPTTPKDIAATIAAAMPENSLVSKHNAAVRILSLSFSSYYLTYHMAGVVEIEIIVVSIITCLVSF
jgi:hypothetical protein